MIELNRSSKTKTRKAFISIALVLALAITGALAFLTARDSAENKFTVGNVDIKLTEPSWDENAAKNIVSGQVIAKDPTIENIGKNDAYVYMMVEIPKASEADIVSTDESGNEVTTTKSNYPLFSFAANEGWILIDSQVGTDIDAYDYYVYGYNTALTPGNTATLFNEVAFANVTSDFVNPYADEGKDLSLDINVTGYAIQSDYYNNEATDAATAWLLYINQNDWRWPDKKYAGLSTISFVAESGEVVHTETAAAGTPVEMYFEPTLAKDGYTFDWVDEATSEVAYSGMPMPEEDTTLTATYTETGYGTETSDFLKIQLDITDAGDVYGIVVGADATHANYPSAPTDIVIPNFISVTISQHPTITNDFVVTSSDAVVTFAGNSSIEGKPDFPLGTYDVPVKQFRAGSSLSSIAETLTMGDAIEYVNAFGSPSKTDSTLKNVVLPYGTTSIEIQSFMNYTALESVNLPSSLTYIGDFAFKGCSSLQSIIVPTGAEFGTVNGSQFMDCTNLTIATVLTKNIPKHCFYNCSSLAELRLANTENIGVDAFMNCSTLKTVRFPSTLKTIDENAFAGCDAINSVTFNEGIQSIGNFAFTDSYSLTDVYVPDSCTSIGMYAFPYGSSSYTASVPSTCTLGTDAFPEWTVTLR